jgi:hypothetical protein
VKKSYEAYQALQAGQKTSKDGKTEVEIPRTPENYIKGLMFGTNAIEEVNKYNQNLGRKKEDQIPVPNQTSSKAAGQGNYSKLDAIYAKAEEAAKKAESDFNSSDKGKANAAAKSGAKGINALAELEAKKKQAKADLKNSLSGEDKKLSELSKTDRKKLIDSGAYSQDKFDGLDKYIDNKKTKLGLTSASGSTTKINSKADAQTKKVLNEYDTLDAKKRDDKAYKEYDYDYKVAKAKYENKKANGELSRAQEIKANETVKKLKAGSGFSKETRELYGLSKDDFYALITNDENGQKFADQALAYGDKLVAEGIEKKNKFRTSKGAVAFGTKAKGGSGGKGGARKGRGKNGKMLKFSTPYSGINKPRTRGAALAREAKLASKKA